MNAYVKGGLGAAFLILVCIGLWSFYSPSLSVNRNPEQYKLIERMERDGAPDFTLPKLDGTEFRLSSTKGKATIVNFWASWCNPCVEEFPSLKRLIDRFGGDVQLVAVSADDEKTDIETFLKAFGATGPSIHVVWDQGRKVSEKWGVGKIPESFLLNAEGKLVRKVMGIEDWATPGAIGYFAELVGGSRERRLLAPPRSSSEGSAPQNGQ